MAYGVSPVSLKNTVQKQYSVTSRFAIPRSSFQGVLDSFAKTATTTSSQTYTVRQGDTLSEICSEALRRRGATPSAQDVATAVESVAKANSIVNPNRIQIGQSLDLSSALSSASGGPRAATLTPSQQLSNLMLSLTAKSSVEKSSEERTERVWKAILDSSGELSSSYGTRKNPFGKGSEFHPGIDLAALPGTGVRAWKSGVVEFSGWKPDYGKVVIVAHEDGTESLYAHNSKNLVTAGQKVDSNTKVALVGSTGRSTGPHLHFEIRENGKAVDPAPLLESDSLQIAKAL